MKHVCAILYTSNTGFTKKYAILLGQAVGLPIYPLEEARRALPDGASVFYMGWLMAGKIMGVTQAKKHFRLIAVCGVGKAEDYQPEVLQKANNLGDVPAFYLRGGYDKERLHGVYRVMMNVMEKVLAGKAKNSPEEAAHYREFCKTSDWVRPEHLAEIVGFLGA